LLRLPEDLSKNAEGDLGIRGGEAQAVDQSADFFLGGSGRSPLGRIGRVGFQVTADAEGVEQERGEALKVRGRGEGVFLRFRRGMGIAGKFVEANCYGLAEVHRAVFFASGNAN
jgi:hypothetical protein